MGKSRKKKKVRKSIVVMSIILLLLLIFAIAIAKKDDRELQNNEDITENTDVADTIEEALEIKEQMLPCDVGEGLVVESIFQFTGMNPDCENQDGENIAALTVKNESDKYLELAEITVKFNDGETLEFLIKDIPANYSVSVFEKSNKSYELTDVCTDITGTVEFKENAGDVMEQVEVSESETTVIITNISKERLENVVVHCHCSLGDTYFGGLTYEYPVKKIEAGEAVTIEAIDCYLGEADVVKISKQ